MIAAGAFAEHARLGPILIFVFIWSTLVYDPIACWTWNSNGWSFVMGGLDFAGGTPVHISSGTAALAIAVYLGKRRGYGTERLAYKPHNTSYVVLGTVFLWFGWFGFNGGSALGANLRAVQACIVTNLAASVGGLTWMFWVSPFPFFPSWPKTFHSNFGLARSRIGVLRGSGPQSVSALVRSLVLLQSPQDLVSSALVSSLVLIVCLALFFYLTLFCLQLPLSFSALLVAQRAISRHNSNSFSDMMTASISSLLTVSAVSSVTYGPLFTVAHALR